MKKRIVIVFLFLTTMVANAQTQFWGLTSAGGTNGNGTIFSTNGSGSNYTVQQSFSSFNEGSAPHGSLIEATDGNMYGFSTWGGTNGMGLIFQFNPTTNQYTVKYNFGTNYTDDGETPWGSLMQASNGKLYGMTLSGGIADIGKIVEYDFAANTYSIVFDFAYVDAKTPHGNLTEASDGKLYGMTTSGGTHNNGTLFQIDLINNLYSKKIDLGDTTMGGVPYGSLMMANDNNLYGMTGYGGVNSKGVIFKYNTTSGTYTKLIDLIDSIGSNPWGSLIQASNGKLYGMTLHGGAFNFGVIFSYDIATNTLTKVFDFDGTNSGGGPTGDLVEAADGKLYGENGNGGANNYGVLFQFDPAMNTFTKKKDLTPLEGGGPYGSLMTCSNGKLYGLNTGGGSSGSGTLAQFDPVTNIYTDLIDFRACPNGKTPKGSFVKAANGKLYGFTSAGGSKNKGVLLEMDPATNTLVKKLDNYYNFKGTLIEANNGYLYGMGDSVICKYDISLNALTLYPVFNNGSNGNTPSIALMQAANGNLYGTTIDGGTNGAGVLFMFNTATGTYTKLYDFISTDGKAPYGSLTQYTDGNLYGMTHFGGANNFGVIFRYNIVTNTYTVLYSFTSTSGNRPYGSLTQAIDGNLYGLTTTGGTANEGVLFQFDVTTSTYTQKINFDGISKGGRPYGDLLAASDGKLYGMTNNGGANYSGIIFSFNPATNTIIKTVNLSNSNGEYPYGNLIEIASPASIIDMQVSDEVTLYPNPSTGKFTLTFNNGIIENGFIEIYNTLGAKVEKKDINHQSSISIELPCLSKGIYFIKISDSKVIMTRKIIVE